MTFEESKWYGILPDYWKTSKLKYVVQLSRTKASEKTNYIGLENIESFTARRVGEAIEPDGDAISFKPGDVLFGKLRPYLSKSLLVNESGCCSGEILVMSPTAIQAKYLLYMTLSTGFVNDVDMSTYGTKMPRANWEYIGNMKIPVPTSNEQRAIVAYLDEKCAAIGESIQKRKEIIEKLQEYRKAVITQAVTKGLDPNVSVKDSHVPWLGQIGITCDTYKLKFGTYMKGRIGWQGLKAEDFIDEGPYCVTSTDFTNGKVDWNKSYHVSEERYDMDPFIQLKKGDLLISKDGTIGKLAFIDELPGPACLNSHLLVLRPLTNRFSNEYLYHVLASNVFVQYYELVSTGSTMQSLSQEKLSNFVIPVWDRNTEKAIVQYLNKKCAEIDETLEKQQTIIDKLEEYKKSIIYNAVTGKIDCRPL